jgi:hypothetical protein
MTVEQLLDEQCVCHGWPHTLTATCLGKDVLLGKYVYKTPLIDFVWRLERLFRRGYDNKK